MSLKVEEIQNITDADVRRLVSRLLEAVAGETYLFLFRKKPKQRTRKQNNYHWAEPVAKFTDWLEVEWQGDGLPPLRKDRENAAHEILKANCGWVDDMVIGENKMTDPFSTTKLDTAGMSRFEDRVVKFLLDLRPACYVETPQEWRKRNGIPEPEETP